MAEELVVTIKKKQALRILDELAEKKMITVESKILKDLSPKKKKQAESFIRSYKQAVQHTEGKIKLKPLDELLNEL